MNKTNVAYNVTCHHFMNFFQSFVINAVATDQLALLKESCDIIMAVLKGKYIAYRSKR